MIWGYIETDAFHTCTCIHILMGYSFITYYWYFAARAVYVWPVVVVGTTCVRMSEGSMSIISSRLGYTNELKGMRGWRNLTFTFTPPSNSLTPITYPSQQELYHCDTSYSNRWWSARSNIFEKDPFHPANRTGRKLPHFNSFSWEWNKTVAAGFLT